MSRGRLIGSLVAVGVIAMVAWIFAFPLGHSVLLGACIVTLTSARRLFTLPDDTRWRPPPDTTSAVGARREVARLSWSMEGLDERVDKRSVQRLRDLADARLAARGLDLEEPADRTACAALLGERALEVIESRPNRPPRFAAYAAAVTAVERLVPREP